MHVFLGWSCVAALHEQPSVLLQELHARGGWHGQRFRHPRCDCGGVDSQMQWLRCQELPVAAYAARSLSLGVLTDCCRYFGCMCRSTAWVPVSELHFSRAVSHLRYFWSCTNPSLINPVRRFSWHPAGCLLGSQCPRVLHLRQPPRLHLGAQRWRERVLGTRGHPWRRRWEVSSFSRKGHPFGWSGVVGSSSELWAPQVRDGKLKCCRVCPCLHLLWSVRVALWASCLEAAPFSAQFLPRGEFPCTCPQHCLCQQGAWEACGVSPWRACLCLGQGMALRCLPPPWRGSTFSLVPSPPSPPLKHPHHYSSNWIPPLLKKKKKSVKITLLKFLMNSINPLREEHSRLLSCKHLLFMSSIRHTFTPSFKSQALFQAEESTSLAS